MSVVYMFAHAWGVPRFQNVSPLVKSREPPSLEIFLLFFLLLERPLFFGTWPPLSLFIFHMIPFLPLYISALART